MHAPTNWKRWLGASFCAALMSATGLAEAQTPAGSPPDARALLLRMAALLGTTQQLSVTVRSSFDTLQTSGQKVEWNEVRTLTISRPDRLRLEVEKSNGDRSLVLFNGKEITTFDEAGRVYAQASQPGGVDETLRYFVRDLGIRLPLAVLFTSRAASDLDRRVQSVEYVEKTGILGTPSHHVIGRTDTVNFQVWISDGDQPLPQRIVLTYPAAKAQPEFRAQFSGWNLAAQPADALFTFTPPAGTSKIPFVAALPQNAPGRAGASTKKGAKQ